MKLKVTVNGIAYSVDVEVEEEQRKLGSIITGGGGGVSNTPAAPTTEDSAHAGPDRPPADGPDRFDEGRKLVIASAHGAQDADEWVAHAQSAGVTVMRLTDIVETGLEDCLSDPGARYEEMDSRARAAVDFC